MNGSTNPILDYFSYFFRAMFDVPSFISREQATVTPLLVFFLILALAVIFLWDRFIKKYDPGFAAHLLLTFLVLNLVVGLMGFLLGIPVLFRSSDPYLAVGIGSPVFILALGAIASWGNWIGKNYRIAGALILCGTGFLFAWVLFTSFLLFATGYNS